MRQDVAYTYARSLFNLTSSLEALQKMEQLKVMLDQKKVSQFFYSPEIPDALKKELLQKYFSGDLLIFILLLLEKKRLRLIPKIFAHYRKLVEKKAEVVRVKLWTPTLINSDLVETLKKKLESLFGKKIQLEQHIDSELIGGGVLIADNQMIDFSLRGKLNQLKQELLA